jgi:hypothetical protein
MSNTQHATKIVTITPQKAAAALKRQELLRAQDPTVRQRYVREELVKKYARDMAAGKWDCNGETIILGPGGQVLDGQHRLLACVEADKPFRTHLVENVSPEAFHTIDTGAGRSMGDQLTIAGKVGGNHLATALTVVWRWERANRRGFEWSARPTRLELFETLAKHPDLEKFTSRSYRASLLMSCGLAGALWYVFAQQDATLAEVFFEALMTGVNLKEDDPVFLLRERLLRDRRDVAARRIKIRGSASATTELVYRAWDSTRRGEKLKKLQLGKGADTSLLTRRTQGRESRKVVGIEEKKS